jgi:hypothetical protein
MAKGKKKNRNRKKTIKVSQQIPNSTNSELGNGVDTNFEKQAATIQKLSSIATEGMEAEEFKELKNVPPTDPVNSLNEIISKGNEALTHLKLRDERSKKIEELAKNKADELDSELLKIKDEKESIQLKLSGIKDRTAALADLQKQLSLKEEVIIKRENDADAGFLQRNKRSLEQLEIEANTIRDEYANLQDKILAERIEWEKELLKKRVNLQSQIDAEIENVKLEIDEKRKNWKIETKRKEEEITGLLVENQNSSKQIRKKSKDIELEQQLISEERLAIEERIEKIAAARIEILETKISGLEERLQVAREDRNRLEKQLINREEADLRFGDRAPEEIFEDLKTLKKEKIDLKKALGERPNAEAAMRLEELERQRENWENEKFQILREMLELKQDVGRKRIAVTELESLRDQKAALEASNELLQKTLEEDIRKVNDLVKGANNISPFPSCSRMDTNDKLQSIISTTDEIKDLKSFTEYIQHRILIDPETNKLLYYSEADIRCFIAGLGMSRLHLLQGISGTGKTSLPLAFARAIGAGQALIEVQAGWRDRQDLIGHFNTFERRFYESEFLQALYKASCPQYSDKPFIVVLDEMNLSHPEQYFADLLSALEQEKHRQRLVLMTAAVEPAPLLLEEGGRKFKIPENVWFIGTANHDETTKDFADKTYDRAHVMELPRHRKEFKPKELKPLSPIGYDALMNSFKMAVEKHSKTTNSAYEFLEKNLADLLGNKFGVGWGNRLERQMQDYVPIIIELGGSLGEATDHILASKLLRKIRDRHDNRPEDIIALRERINTEWPSLDPNSKPSKSFIILSDELRRLGNYEE